MSELRVEIDAVELDDIIAGLSTVSRSPAYTAKALMVLRDLKPVVPVWPAWYDAEDGEIWKLEDADTTCQYLVLSSRFFLLPLLAPGETGWAAASFANDFNWGVRLWPEADSQKETQ